MTAVQTVGALTVALVFSLLLNGFLSAVIALRDLTPDRLASIRRAFAGLKKNQII
jgi:hypothetical protein